MVLNTVFQCRVLYSHQFIELNSFSVWQMRIIAERKMKELGNVGLREGSENFICFMAEPNWKRALWRKQWEWLTMQEAELLLWKGKGKQWWKDGACWGSGVWEHSLARWSGVQRRLLGFVDNLFGDKAQDTLLPCSVVSSESDQTILY